MSDSDNKKPEQMTEENRSAWVREQYQKATKYMAEKGLVVESVATEESRYVAPLVAVWKLQAMDKQSYWVISGDLPADHIPVANAVDGREALRNFSMKWQLQAQNLMANAADNTQVEFANLLVSRAEGLYQMFDNEKLWTTNAS
ncbi:DUF4826 family protein [Thalassotalea mangrovi]|uniref:DUF4826 family protein n=1 Tax=Thalassotalea mangrovi TaxID=2572245 RepID=A0A4U1B2G0_9GAMM|nr:DUF4826 family protein [Thalassotalea mangrovi]TKB43757.1 DUF4826 family protein [Thalassotalea mangrovi]